MFYAEYRRVVTREVDHCKGAEGYNICTSEVTQLHLKIEIRSCSTLGAMLRTLLPSLLHRCVAGVPTQELLAPCLSHNLQGAASLMSQWGRTRSALHTSVATQHGHSSDDEDAET